MTENIFISYRREDASGYAIAIYNKLCGAMGKEHIFMDVNAIDPGVDFVERIENAIASCDVLLVLIGKKWLTASNGPNRRLDEPNDFVRLEVSTALKRDIRVVPILVDDAIMPKTEELPDNLKLLARRNALRASNTSFNDDIDRLIEKLCDLLSIKYHDKPDDDSGSIIKPSLPIGLWLATIGYTLLSVVVFMGANNIVGYLFLANSILLIIGCSIASLGKVKLWLVPISAAIIQCVITIICFFLILGDPVVVAFLNLIISLIYFMLGRFYYKKSTERNHSI
jgi:TIR domain